MNKKVRSVRRQEHAGAKRLALTGRRDWLLRTAAGITLLILVLHIVDPEQVASLLRSFDAGWLCLALLCAVAANCVSAWRWKRLASGLGIEEPMSQILAIYAQGISINTVVPGATVGGDAFRVYRLAQRGHGAMRAATSVVLDRLSGLLVLCVLSAAASVGLWLPLGGEAMDPSLAWAAVAAFVLPVLLALPWLVRPALIHRLPFERIRALHRMLYRERGLMLRVSLPSLAVQLLSGTTLFLCVCATSGASGQWLGVVAVAAPVFLAAALPLSAGGFGPREAAAAMAFPLVGLSADAGLAAAIAYGALATLQGMLAAPLFALHRVRDAPARVRETS